MRTAFYTLKEHAGIQDKSEIVSQVDMSEEKQILQSIKKKEFMGETQNENLLEIQVDNEKRNSEEGKLINFLKAIGYIKLYRYYWN